MSWIDADAHRGARSGHAIAGAVDLRTRRAPWHRPVGGRVKRAFDIAFAAVVLLLLAPMIELIAALLRAGLERSFLVGEEHVGFAGRAFTAYMFRTSINDGAPNFSREPTSATCLGSMLRDSGLDRLPQLISILRGDMSFVGPRPIMLDSSEHASADYLAVRPGLISAFRTDRLSGLGTSRRTAMDRYYARHWTIWMDLAALLGVRLQRT